MTKKDVEAKEKEEKKPFRFEDLVGEMVDAKIEGEPTARAKVLKVDSFACVFDFEKYIRVIPWSSVKEIRKSV